MNADKDTEISASYRPVSQTPQSSQESFGSIIPDESVSVVETNLSTVETAIVDKYQNPSSCFAAGAFVEENIIENGTIKKKWRCNVPGCGKYFTLNRRSTGNIRKHLDFFSCS